MEWPVEARFDQPPPEQVLTELEALPDSIAQYWPEWLGPNINLKKKPNPSFPFTHYLLFPPYSEKPEKRIPQAWILAAWPYITKFNIPFGFSVDDATNYTHVTIVASVDADPAVTKEMEDYLNRLGVTTDRVEGTTAKTLEANFKARIDSDKSYLSSRA